MPPKTKPRILIADDERDLLEVLKANLEAHGLLVETAKDGRQALEAIRAKPPDIAVLDLKMPRLDGFGVCRALRKDPLLENLPVILLSASGTRERRIEGLNLGADDFIAKPVDVGELLARIRMILRRTRQTLDANPLTQLPGNVSIETRIKEALDSRSPLAVLYLDLNQFKAYNDAYGFNKGDRVIKATAELLVRLAHEKGRSDFVGHIGGDDFIILTTPARMESLAKRIIPEFDRLAPGFYNETDRQRGTIVSTDRAGRAQRFPLLSIAIGIAHNLYRPLESYAQISEYGTELKKRAKTEPGSAYAIDRRKSG